MRPRTGATLIVATAALAAMGARCSGDESATAPGAAGQRSGEESGTVESGQTPPHERRTSPNPGHRGETKKATEEPGLEADNPTAP